MFRSRMIIGGLWLLLGAAAGPWTTYDLWRIASDPEYGLSSTFYEPSFWVIQMLFPIFFFSAFVVGVGLLKKRRWGVVVLRVLAPLMLAYTLAYTLLDHDHYWWWGVLGLGCLILAGFSLPFAYAKRPKLPTLPT
jgi:hypothetical protein